MSSYSELLKLKLSELDNNNPEYEKLLTYYQQKINVSTKYIGKSDFINQELKRIKESYIKPLEVFIGGDFKKVGGINYTEYVKIAYDALLSGNDFELEKIVSGAKQQYLQMLPQGASFNEIEFSNSIVKHLQLGVAYLKYEKFLTDQLNENVKKEDQSTRKPWHQKFWRIIVGIGVIVGIIAGIFQIGDSCNKPISESPSDTTKKAFNGPYKPSILVANFSYAKDDPFSGPLVYELDQRFNDTILIENIQEFYKHGAKLDTQLIRKIFINYKSDKGLLVHGSIYNGTVLYCNIKIYQLPLKVKILTKSSGYTPNILIADSTSKIEIYKRAPYLADFIETLFNQCFGNFIYADTLLIKTKTEEFDKMSASFKSEFFSLAGNNLIALEKFENAIIFYHQALNLGMNRDEIKFNLALAYYLNKEYISARDLLNEIKNRLKDDASALLNRLNEEINKQEIQKFGVIEKEGKYAVRYKNGSQTEFIDSKIIIFIWNGKRYYIFRDFRDNSGKYSFWPEIPTGTTGTGWTSLEDIKEAIKKNKYDRKNK